MNFGFDAFRYRYPSRRHAVYARNGMVCSSQPLASQAGLEILKKGGNAFDAVLAAAACLNVVEPMSDTLGGDAFALVWHKGQLYGLNASGPAPLKLSREALLDAGYTEMPRKNWGAVTVPGMVSGWAELNSRFGRLSLKEIVAPAVRYAREGFPVQPTVSALFAKCMPELKKLVDPQFFGPLERMIMSGLRPSFMSFGCCSPSGRLAGDRLVPLPGDVLRFPEMADTLEEIGETLGESFYRGKLAKEISRYAERTGGYLTEDDLAAYRAEWVQAISTSYRGYDIFEIPPNGHGLVVLMALNLLKEMDLSGGPGDPAVIHRQIEAMKLAFTDGKRYITDPRYMKAEVGRLLSDDYAAGRRALIGEEALIPSPGDPFSGKTVYLNAADGEGNMISYIQSCYENFGSGVTIPGTGIVMNNRGWNFTMDPAMENCVAPGKKPYHTIIPGFITKDGEAVGPFGVMGGFMQPQGHVQVLCNMFDFGMNPQEALDAPRWMWTGGKKVTMESGFGQETAGALARRGHEVTIPTNSLTMGRGQIILRNDEGTLCGAVEPRTDSQAAVC